MALQFIETKSSFRAGVLWGLEQAVKNRAFEIWAMDPDFADWPLEQDETLSLLTAFVKMPTRRITFVCETDRAMLLGMPKFVAWRRTWSHTCRMMAPGGAKEAVPTVFLVDAAWGIQGVSDEPFKAIVRSRPTELSIFRDAVASHLKGCHEAFSQAILGV
jgi:hypothetical protein